ncbi:hypothetical protein FDI85_gp006 [Erwinia phage Machina]|uniref:Uncharacterized protein n=2 Tax=Machinavirus machina TaxID=2169990 RepID=A0A1B2IDM5_9CAUD|nr:hypothetical protein BIZ81_gp006 [Erwinia phage vB_EamM_Huxley]YP_009617195.1 hypothetical protein FDI85_gp006 [Erwinia phage Machina]ANZ49359.1 hypothetical protein HUXLEY_277 [Erwinia phage vB_EamM_Huxley]ANZ49916.1 hypothetical protein MACHINA_278 [Erwinia phage Machina]
MHLTQYTWVPNTPFVQQGIVQREIGRVANRFPGVGSAARPPMPITRWGALARFQDLIQEFRTNESS